MEITRIKEKKSLHTFKDSTEYKHSNIQKVQNKESLIKNACYSVTKYYLCRKNNKRSLLGRKQRHQVVRSFPNRYLFQFNKQGNLFISN